MAATNLRESSWQSTSHDSRIGPRGPLCRKRRERDGARKRKKAIHNLILREELFFANERLNGPFGGTKSSFESASIRRCLPASRFSFCSFVGCLRWLQVHSPECWRPYSLGFRYEVSGRTLCLACWAFWCST